MKVAIVGYRTEGEVSAKYWQGLGNEITVCDQDQALKVEGLPYQWRTGEGYLNNLDEFDVIVRTAGLHPKKIIEANPAHPEIEQRITTSINEFMQACPTTKVVGITGTKGKGTTSTLVAQMLGQAGFSVHLGGNIGIAPLQMLPGIKTDDWVVLEVSSFQAIDVSYSPHIGVCLMVVDEHLDWHTDRNEYIKAKQRLFGFQTPSDRVVYNADNEQSRMITSQTPAKRVAYEVPARLTKPVIKDGAYVDGDTVYFDQMVVCKTGDVHLRGRHNLENVCAAIAAVWEAVGQDTNVITRAIQSFKGLEHRIEFVREFRGVDYYNDSFSTTPETAIACMQSFEEPKVMILGGSDKGIEFIELANQVIQNNVRHVIAIGETGPKIAELLRHRDFNSITEGPATMPEIVSAASGSALPGDVVLLSTGCASFGLFKDYKDRGEQFKKAVLEQN